MDVSGIRQSLSVPEVVAVASTQASHTTRQATDQGVASNEQMDRVLSAIKASRPSGHTDTSVNISFDEQSNNFVIRITNQSTGELIREVPSEQIRRAMAYLINLAGLALDQTA